ncbi:MAG: hypothetical protein ACXADY_23120 [Candidatus Hodarchaeales archaeon]
MISAAAVAHEKWLRKLCHNPYCKNAECDCPQECSCNTDFLDLDTAIMWITANNMRGLKSIIHQMRVRLKYTYSDRPAARLHGVAHDWEQGRFSKNSVDFRIPSNNATYHYRSLLRLHRGKYKHILKRVDWLIRMGDLIFWNYGKGFTFKAYADQLCQDTINLDKSMPDKQIRELYLEWINSDGDAKLMPPGRCCTDWDYENRLRKICRV